MKAFMFGVALGLLLTACETAPYYKAMEVVGVEKRELLVDRIDDTRQSMAQGKSDFARLITVYRETADAPAGNLEGAYERYEDAYDDTRDRVRDIETDIDTVKRVADDMFAEWEGELKLYQDEALRAESEARLADMRTRLEQLERTFDETEQRMDAALFPFRDRVLLLKRNMNTATLAQMKADAPALTEQVRAVNADLDRSIAEARAFTASLRG